jgi:hypothetical protein
METGTVILIVVVRIGQVKSRHGTKPDKHPQNDPSKRERKAKNERRGR